MKSSINSGRIKINDTKYEVAGLTKSNKIILEVTDTSSIYVSDHKSKEVIRTISKDGYIKIDSHQLYVLDVPGVKFHLGVE